MNYNELLTYLYDNQDKKYADFSKSLSNSDYKVIGIRMPILKQFVKDHYKDEDLKIEDFKLGEILEIDYLYFTISLKRLSDLTSQLEFVHKNIKKAKSWIITDCINSFLKKPNLELCMAYFEKMYNSKHIYERRYAYVCLLNFHKDNRVLEVLNCIREDDEYMVMMAEAWLLATIAIDYPEEIYNKLLTLKDDKLRRKTIAKIVESFRISDEMKEKFKLLRSI